jgi:diaminopimelate decarboxylase
MRGIEVLHTLRVLELFPLTAAIDSGGLTLGGVGAASLADAFGTPVVVYCEETIRAQARAYKEAAPNALVVYGTKAFANVGLLRVLADEGVGADVSTLGELAFAQAAGIAGDRLVFHGNNKNESELRAAADAGAIVVLDELGEAERAAAAGVRRVLVRLTPGVDAHTHQAIRTAHDESKFGMPPERALAVIADARARELDVVGVHFHVGSQLARIDESLLAVQRLLDFVASAEESLGWRPALLDIGGGLGIPYTHEEQLPDVREFVAPLVAALPPDVQVVLEPGRSLVGRAGVTLYRVGVIKESGGVTYVAIDGGMSDNPRPQLYDARYEALLANRADELADGVYRIAGKHCESGDVLIQAAELPRPRRGDLLAVPATGAYTLAMGSNYNGVPRPPAVLVRNGSQRLIRHRESVEDLLRHEAEPSGPPAAAGRRRSTRSSRRAER